MASDDATETRRGAVPGTLIALIVATLALALLGVSITVARTTPSPSHRGNQTERRQ
jgi:hypothetical protein